MASRRNYKAGADRGNKLSEDRFRGFRGASYGAAGPAVRIDPKTGERKIIADVPSQHELPQSKQQARKCGTCSAKHERVTITDGMRSDGTLHIVTFCSAACAAKSGYGWAGRRTGA